ncbi:MAG: DUF4276 family protein [Magnetococcales bacterium]|nr:DUF4276 family protein [Magnetococcales bacterium]
MQLVFFLEELSARVFLEGLLDRILPERVTPRFVVFDGKSDLDRSLVRKMRGWLEPDSRFVVLRDRDAGDCREIKQRLVDKCREAGQESALVRIACRELESWYLGDLNAVAQALDARNAASQQNRSQFRDPDGLDNPVQALTRLAPTYQKVAGSRALGRVLDPDHNTSHSFRAFVAGVRRLVTEDQPTG